MSQGLGAYKLTGGTSPCRQPGPKAFIQTGVGTSTTRGPTSTRGRQHAGAGTQSTQSRPPPRPERGAGRAGAASRTPAPPPPGEPHRKRRHKRVCNPSTQGRPQPTGSTSGDTGNEHASRPHPAAPPPTDQGSPPRAHAYTAPNSCQPHTPLVPPHNCKAPRRGGVPQKGVRDAEEAAPRAGGAPEAAKFRQQVPKVRHRRATGAPHQGGAAGIRRRKVEDGTRAPHGVQGAERHHAV